MTVHNTVNMGCSRTLFFVLVNHIHVCLITVIFPIPVHKLDVCLYFCILFYSSYILVLALILTSVPCHWTNPHYTSSLLTFNSKTTGQIWMCYILNNHSTNSTLLYTNVSKLFTKICRIKLSETQTTTCTIDT